MSVIYVTTLKSHRKTQNRNIADNVTGYKLENMIQIMNTLRLMYKLPLKSVNMKTRPKPYMARNIAY